MTACLTSECAQSVLNCLSAFRGRTVVLMKNFRGSWGIWHPQPQSRHSDCFIRDHFRTDYTPESRDGHGTAVKFAWPSCWRVPLIQPLDRPCLSTGRSAHRKSFLACHCHDGCLQCTLVLGTHAPRDSPSLVHPSEEGHPFSWARHHWRLKWSAPGGGRHYHSGCGAFHGPLMYPGITRSDRHIGNVSVYICNPQGTETLCPHATTSNHRWLPETNSQLFSIKPDEWTHLLPIYTRMHGEWLSMQNSLAKFLWRFLLIREDSGSQDP